MLRSIGREWSKERLPSRKGRRLKLRPHWLARGREMWYTHCVTSNTITIRLRRPKAEIEAAARPNINAWVNELIEKALGPRQADWQEHFNRPSSGRTFRSTGKVERRER